MRSLSPIPKTARFSFYAAVLVASLLVVACGGGDAAPRPGQVDAGSNAGLTAASLGDIESDFEAHFYCKNADSKVALERYLIGAHRDVGIPSTSSPDYLAALPPICIVSPIGGVPPYSAKAWVDGVELRPVLTGTTELTFGVPPLEPGNHKIEFVVTDSAGERGVGSSELELYWSDRNRIQVDFTAPPARLTEFAPGVPVEFVVDYEAFELSDQPQLGIERFQSQSYEVTWTFGDGASEAMAVTSRTGRLTASHAFENQGMYTVTVAIEGQTYGQRGSSSVNVDVRPLGSTRTESGEVVQQWKLVETRVNPAQAPLRHNEVNRVFSDDSLNAYVDRTAALNLPAIIVNKAAGKGPMQSFIGTYTFRLESAPEALTVGEDAQFAISGSATTIHGSDSAGEVLRVSGMPGGGESLLVISSSEPTGAVDASFLVPTPSSVGETIVISLSVDGCAACVVEWVYRYG